MSESVDWAYWNKLPEVKVFEAIALLHDTEPEREPPEDSSPEYRKTLRLLLACMSDRSIFTPGSLNISDPALNGVKLIEVGAWAKSNGYKLLEKFPRPVQLSKAPPPITPLRGAGLAPSRQPVPAKWNKWGLIPKCELWQAVCLTLDIEPDDEKHGIRGWLQSRRGVPYGFPAEYADRLQVAQANMSTNGPIRPQSRYAGVLENPHADVLLSDVAAAAIRFGWAIPDAMHALVESAAPASTPESRMELTSQQQRELNAMRVPPTNGMTISSQWLKNGPTPPEPTTERIEVKAPAVFAPVLKQRAQEARIIELLKAQGYDPLELAQRAPGKPGPKAEIRTLALQEPALFTLKTFDTAWQRLRAQGELAGAE